MRLFWFVAGDQAIHKSAMNMLDAWFQIEILARTKPIASEYRELPIQCFDCFGTLLACGFWDFWHATAIWRLWLQIPGGAGMPLCEGGYRTLPH